jgi:hypothetical protein
MDETLFDAGDEERRIDCMLFPESQVCSLRENTNVGRDGLEALRKFSAAMDVSMVCWQQLP